MVQALTFEYDVFISYNHNDETWARHLATRLEQETFQDRKLKVFFAPWDIKPGESIPQRLEHALPRSRKVCLIISPASVESEWVKVERYVTHCIDITQRQLRLIPLYRQATQIPAFLQQINHIDFRDDTIFEHGYRLLLATIRDEPLPRGEDVLSSVSGAVATSVPRPPVVGFVARRDSEGLEIVAKLKQELSPLNNQIVTLWGAGGVGKTTIAAEVARELSDIFSQRIVWLSADGRIDLPFSTFLDEVATQLGDNEIRKFSLDAKSELVRKLVASAPTLVVLDNFETISAGERQLSFDFLTRTQCCALITTRQKLEHSRSVPITGMAQEEAEKFLQLLIEQTQDPQVFTSSIRRRVIETAEANPLIMEWIVGQIDLANDPTEVLNELTHGEGDAAHRVFDRSYNLPQLNDGGRAVLLALSLFAPSAGRPTVAAVAGMDLGKTKDKKRFKRAQETLASLWLIKKTDGGIRLAVGGLTRELTKAHLANDTRAKAFSQRFVNHYVRYSAAHGEPSTKDFDALVSEKNNLLTAANVGLSLGHHNAVLTIAYVLSAALDRYGYWNDAVLISSLALTSARSAGSDKETAAWLHNLAAMRHQRGELDDARLLYADSLSIEKKLDNKEGIANTLHNMGWIAQDRGELSEARNFYDESLRLGREIGNERRVAGTLHHLGWLAQEQGKFDAALKMYEESLQISRALRDDYLISRTLHHLGLLAQEQGQFDRARELYFESLSRAKKLGDQVGIASTLHQLGTIHLLEGAYEEAESELQDSLTILTRIGDRRDLAECIETIARLKLAQQQLAEAEKLLHDALTIAESLGMRLRIGSIKHSLALLAEREGRLDHASIGLQEALSVFTSLHSPKADDVRRDLQRVGNEEPKSASMSTIHHTDQ